MRASSYITLLLVALPSLATAEPVYTATEILGPTGAPIGVSGLNNNGDLVGTDADHGFVYLRSSRTFFPLPHPTPNSTDSATALNDHGKVAGMSFPSLQPPQTAVWYLSGGSEMLDAGIASGASGVSNNGDVVVTAFTGHDDQTFVEIFSWLPTLHSIGVPGFSDANIYPSHEANAINDSGDVVGESSISTFSPDQNFISGVHAYLYKTGQLTDLGVLGNPDPTDNLGNSDGNGLNNHDDVVGQTDIDLVSTDPSCAGCVVSHAFLWQRGKFTDLGNLGHVREWNSSANAINDAGEIVGWADANVGGKPTPRAFVFIKGAMYNLTFLVQHRDLNVRLTAASAINCHGWILASGYEVTAPNVGLSFLLIPKGHHLREECPAPKP